MIALTPLIILLGTILALLAVQQLLVRVQPRPGGPAPDAEAVGTANPEQKAPATKSAPVPPPTPRRRGRSLLKSLSVVGLDERGVEQMRTLMRKGDTEGLATFLAFNRPGVVELDTYIAQLRDATTGDDEGEDAPADLPTPPAGILHDALSDAEWERLLAFPAKTQRLITRQFMSRFGGHAFREPFRVYTRREKQVALHVPPIDKDRATFEILAESGMARRGRHIPLAQRLTVLKMSQLRQMARDLRLDRKFKRKSEATEQLAATPGAAVLLSMQYVVDDLFLLLPMDEDPQLIEQEWDYLFAYAKLLSAGQVRHTV